MDDLLDEHGITHWIDWGTLLGAVRGQELIPWDTDADMSLLERDAEAVRALRPDIEAAGYVTDPAVTRIEFSQVNKLHLDLEYWTLQDGLLRQDQNPLFVWPGMINRTDFPQRLLDRMEQVMLSGHEFPAPSPVDELLREHRYGPDYMTPTRRILAPDAYHVITREEMTPAVADLLHRVAERSGELLEIAASHSRLLRMRFVEPGGGKWAILSGLPLVPENRHLEALRLEIASDGGTGMEKLLWSLAWIERGIEEYGSPPRFVRVRRTYRRLVRFAAAAARKRRAARER